MLTNKLALSNTMIVVYQLQYRAGHMQFDAFFCISAIFVKLFIEVSSKGESERF